MSFMKQSRQENLIYLAVWGLLFAAPLLSLYVRTSGDADTVFRWTEVFVVWRHLAVFLVLFLIHNFLLAPLLIHAHRRVAYFSIMAAVLAAFIVYQCSGRPEMNRHKGPRPPHRMEMPARHHPPFEEPHRQWRRGDVPPPVVGVAPTWVLRDIFVVVMIANDWQSWNIRIWSSSWSICAIRLIRISL